MPPATPPPGVPSAPELNTLPQDLQEHPSAYNRLRKRANTIGSIVALFLFLIVLGLVIGYFVGQANKKPAKSSSGQNVESLSQSQLNQLTQLGSNVGTNNETLSIAANALFRQNENVVGTLSVGGQLNANGPVTLSQLNITGNTAATGLNVGSNLAVTGSTTLQGALTINNLANINGNLNVTGTAGMGTLNANSIAVRNLSISGPLTIGHLVTQGSNPSIQFGGALGAGGTASVSGNDTSGQVNLSTGSTTSAGLMAVVGFRAAFGATVHVQLTPINEAAAQSNAQAWIYVTPTATGFDISCANAPSGHFNMSYDYLVTQ